MKLAVIKGYVHPLDGASKRRYAVVLGMVDGRVLIAPCTTYPERNGLVVPYGSALITRNSPAYPASGLTANAVAISIRDAALVSIDSNYLKKSAQVGVIDLSADKHLFSQLKILFKEYDVLQSRSFY